MEPVDVRELALQPGIREQSLARPFHKQDPTPGNRSRMAKKIKNKSSNAKMDRCAKAPPFVSQPGTDGP
jgi:hypothetical protein